MRPNGVPRSGGSGAGTAEPRKLRKPQDDLALRWRTVQKMVRLCHCPPLLASGTPCELTH